MKKNILLVLLFVAVFTQLASAQASLAFTPNVIEKEGVADQVDLFAEVVGKAKIENTGDQPITIRWVRVVDTPEEWISMICDLNSCYPAQVYSNVAPDLDLDAPITLNPGDTTNLDVHLQPKGVAGEGTVTIEVYDVNNQDQMLVSGDFHFTISMPTSTNEAFKPSISIFPNPATDYIQLSNAGQADRLVVYNIVGREMRSFNTAPGQRYFIGDLPNGLYLASLVSNKKGILTTLRVQKSALRP